MPPRYSRAWVLPLTAAAQLMLALDFSIVNVALAQIQIDLGFTTTGLQWVATAYALTFGALLLVGGRLGDRFGLRRMLVVGLVIFGVASLVGGLATTAVVLVAARFVQGVGAALVAPAALATLNHAYRGLPGNTRAMSLFQASVAVGASAGIVLGGVLTGLVGWRWVLLVNPPLVLVLVVLVMLRLPAGTGFRGARLNLPGALTVTLASAALIFGVTRGEQDGFSSLASWVPLSVAVLGGIGFGLIERRSDTPMIPPALLGGGRRAVLTATAVVGAILGAYVYFIALYLQHALHLSAVGTGFALLPATVTSFLASALITPRMLPRLGTRGQLVLAFVLLGLGQLWLSALEPESGYLVGVLAGILLSAAGIGLAVPAASVAVMSGAPTNLRGTAGAVFTSSQQIGSAIGLATLATVAAVGNRHGSAVNGYDYAFSASAALAVVAVVVVATSAPGPPRRT
ncbi:MFS family permease [Rhodococcus sp. 27YEA15]|uniref:MFS transporter n=1 Tax=Rhodococcus sp. 27YEA15 TaxID=3156259 RepID=UPI003C7AA00E